MMPPALLLLQIWPKTLADQHKLATGLRLLMAEDPTLAVRTNQMSGEVVLGALGELQLEIVLDRLKREFDVTASVGQPQIACKEAITRRAEGEGRYIRQAGGHGEYAHAKIRLVPRQPGEGYEFVNAIVDGSVPNEFIKPIDEGVREAMTNGVLACYPVDDLGVELYGGSFHAVDSSEMAFKIAGSMAFTDAARKAGPVILEPVMLVEVVVPAEHTDDVMKNLSGRRGVVWSRDDRDGARIINALVPLAEMFGYAADLRSRTRGRATYSMQLDRYQQIPSDPNTTGDDRNLPVGAPLKPAPRPNESAIALPEPDDDGLEA